MGARTDYPLVLSISDLSGGINQDESPLLIAENQVEDAKNVEWVDTSFGRRRHGLTSFTAPTGITTDRGIQQLFRHVPGADDSAAELWAVGSTGATSVGVRRWTAGGGWTAPTIKDEISASSYHAHAVSFNGKLFFAARTGVDRLQVWDPTLSVIRRTGLAAPAAPTVADTGAGTYPATIRHYKVSYIDKLGSDIRRRSELSAAVSFTPSGAGTAARVTKPASISENETHWELWGSPDDKTYYLLATTAVGTTTYDDSADPATYSGDNPPPAGRNANFPAVKYLLTDGNRLLGAHDLEGTKKSRVYFTPAAGSADIGDDERVPTDLKYWVDVNEADGSAITGLAGPFNGRVIVFKLRSIAVLTPTGNVDAPYRVDVIHRGSGALSQRAIIAAEDAEGRPAIAFLGLRGFYLLTVSGLRFIGRGVQTNTRTYLNTSEIDSLVAGSLGVVGPWAVLHIEHNQVWFGFYAGGIIDHDVWVYHLLTGGWSRFNFKGGNSGIGAAVPFSIAPSTLSPRLVPYLGLLTDIPVLNVVLGRYDTAAQTDTGTTYVGQIKSRTYGDRLTKNLTVAEPVVAFEGTTTPAIRLSVIRDYGAISAETADVTLAPPGGSSGLLQKFNLMMPNGSAFQFTLEDTAGTTHWEAARIEFSLIQEGRR